MQPGACFVNSLNHIGAGTNRMADIDAAADARIHALYGLQDIQRRMPQLSEERSRGSLLLEFGQDRLVQPHPLQEFEPGHVSADRALDSR